MIDSLKPQACPAEEPHELTLQPQKKSTCCRACNYAVGCTVFTAQEPAYFLACCNTALSVKDTNLIRFPALSRKEMTSMKARKVEHTSKTPDADHAAGSCPKGVFQERLLLQNG